MSDLMEYEHPTDYVVIPIAMRDRLWERLQKSEARVKKLEAAIEAHHHVVSTWPNGPSGLDKVLYLVLEDR
jgi:hypothetical protein